MERVMNLSAVLLMVFVMMIFALNVVHAEIIDGNLNIEPSSEQNYATELFGSTETDVFVAMTEVDSEGNYAAAGYSEGGAEGDITLETNGTADALIVKFDSENNSINYNLVGENLRDYFYSVVATSDGGYLATGYSQTRKIIDETSKIVNDGYIVKFDQNLNVDWEVKLNGDGNDKFTQGIELPNGNFLVSGYTDSNAIEDVETDDGRDALLVQFDGAGEMIEGSLQFYGGDGDDQFFDLDYIESTDTYVAAGRNECLTPGECSTFNGTSVAAYTMTFKLDENYMIVDEEEQTFGGAYTDYYYDVKATSDGGFIASGMSTGAVTDSNGVQTSGNGGKDGLIVKYDSEGNEEWNQLVGGSYEERFDSAIEVFDDNGDAIGYATVGNSCSALLYGTDCVAGTGYPGQDGLFVQFDLNGEVVNQELFIGDDEDELEDIIQIGLNEYKLLGFTISSQVGENSDINNGGYDGMIIDLQEN